MSTIGNLLWFILGGFVMGLAWILFGVLAYLSIIGIPWGRACFVMAGFTFFPFGREAISRSELSHHDDVGTGAWGVLGNVMWFLLAGVWLALGHVIAAIADALTIIGIPFAIQHLKLAGLSIAPIGKTIVDKDLAKAARRSNASQRLNRTRK